MTRPLAAPSRQDIESADLASYDEAMDYWGAMFTSAGGDPDPVALSEANPWAAAMLHSPPFALQRSQLSTLLRAAPDRAGSFSHAEREWVGMVLAAELGTYGVALIHAAEAVRVGVRPEAIEAVLMVDGEGLTAPELLTATFIRQVVGGGVQDETFDSMTAHLGTRGVVEYIYYITMIWTVVRQFQAFGGGEARPDEVVEAARSAVEGVE